MKDYSGRPTPLYFAERVSSELGFDVFDDYIDHRYDTLKFFIDRIEYAQSEITRLCNISLNEWTEILYELYPRLLKNYNLLNSHFVNQNITTNPIKLNNSYLILKINDKKTLEKKVDLKKELEKLINIEKNKQLNQYSNIYFNKIKQNTFISEI